MKTNALFVGSATLALALALAPSEARADTTCSAFVQQTVQKLKTSGGWYDFDLTMHRTNTPLVSYSHGTMWLTGTGNEYWALTGQSNQLFNDRYNGNQPFGINAADTITPYISTDGRLYIYYNTWNFSTDWDMGCVDGNVMTKYIPGHGVVTLTLRGWNAPIQ